MCWGNWCSSGKPHVVFKDGLGLRNDLFYSWSTILFTHFICIIQLTLVPVSLPAPLDAAVDT